MRTRTAQATWQGDLESGRGTMRSPTGAVDGAYSFPSRFEDGEGTNPEELIGAAHAGCFSMALSLVLGEAGHQPDRIDTTASVTLGEVGGAPTITTVHLDVTGRVPGIDAAEFRRLAEEAKKGCPVSRALAGVDITLEAKLAD